MDDFLSKPKGPSIDECVKMRRYQLINGNFSAPLRANPTYAILEVRP